jgi:hypothetical protein
MRTIQTSLTSTEPGNRVQAILPLMSLRQAAVRPSTSEFLSFFVHVRRKHMDYAFWDNDRWALTCCARVSD